ncbi:IPT/TIG domain-containing protein [Candidatus Peregrinibacteria bacterium]|nr:IPT/TIG domain-containing protein [Candidatus Peregrinibacteria bacterium]
MEYPTPKNRWNKYLMGIGIALMTLITTYLVHTNPSLNMADLTIDTIPSSASELYIPNYVGGVGESGLLEIKAFAAMPSFDSITFSLNYNPVNALIFENNPIIFDATTEFQSAAFQMTASPEEGKLIVTIISDDVTLGAGDILFKLNTQLNDDLPVGQIINLSVSDLAILDGANPVATNAIPNSTITVQGQNELRALNAETINATHVAVEFSDYLENVGNPADYVITGGLAVSNVEPGPNYGFSQKYTVLTTATQTAGTEYAITMAPAVSNILSNQQGKVDAVYSNVLFYGYGQTSATISDFGIIGASVSGYNSIAVVFSDDVEAASVTKNDFILNAGAITISNVVSVTGNTIILSVTGTNLLKDDTYTLTTTSPSAVLRDSDGASMGMDRITFAGTKNGPRLIAVTVTNVGGTYRAQLTFDENIQLGGVANNPIGRLYTTVAGNGGTLIDDSQLLTYKQSISGATLTLENVVFNNPNANFTFAVSAPGWLTNAQGVPVDDTYKSISFWGYGHNNSVNSVGTVDVTRKDVFIIPKGTLDFSTVDPGEVTVLYDSGTSPLASQAVQSVGMSGENLEVVMVDELNPDRHYIVRIDNGSGSIVAAKDFAVSRALNVAYAEAISATDVRVYFNNNIDERDVDFTDFSVTTAAGVPIAVSAATIDPGYQSIVLTTAGPFNTASVYKVTVSTPGDIYSYGGDYLLKKSVYFTGYNTQYSVSPVTLSSIEVVDARTLRMNFSDDIDLASFTPVNLDIFWFNTPSNPANRTDLVVTGITRIDEDSYELKTAIQDTDMNYFVVFRGVEDVNGLHIGNHKVNNFFGFKLPTASISLVTPSTVSNDTDTNVIISGTHLDVINQVRVGTEVVQVSSQSPTSLTIVVPAGFTSGLYNITLIDSANHSLIFTNALLVTLPEQGLVVHSDQSKSIPYTVPNDGVTVAKLWALVEDPVDLNNVSSVVINLSQIGGPSTVEMTKDTGTQPQFSQWYTYETTVPPTVETKDDPYLLPVEVRRGSDKFYGTVAVRVSKDVQQSVAPVIDHVYISPLSVPPDDETPIRISAQITDQDGADTIDSVVADLGSLGIGFKILEPIGEVTEGGELETQFFESEEFTVPDTTALGTYNINVVASDITGERTTSTLTLEVSTASTGPQIDADVSYISPRKSIPRDGATSFSINAFVSDSDGISDIQSVTATFSTIGIDPVALKMDAEASTEGESAWYQAGGLTIPKTAPLGIHNIEIRATDKSGGIANLILKVEVTHKDTLGDPPRVVDDRAYTTPRVAINDGKTPVTLYVFVQDDDGDIKSVVANLSEIGQVGPQNGGTLGSEGTEVSNGGCPTGSNILVCMNPSVSEGANGQWYILPNVTVNTLTSPSPNPYQIEVIVTDNGGKTTRGYIPVYVGTGDSITDQQEPPRALAAIPTSETTLEILFNKEISANSVHSSGRGFTISSQSNVNEELYVVGASINPAGTVVTLSTSNQVPGKRYTLTVSKDIKDIVGRGVIEGAANRLNFSGFQASRKAPILEYIQATNFNEVELEFRDSLKPSSVRTGLSQTDASSQYGISIYDSEDSTQKLAVYGVSLGGSGNVLRIKTGPQIADKKYRINIEGLESYDGTKLPVALNKGFKGYNLSVARHAAAANLADLNNDGRVDFSDFTIFSSVYGTIYFGTGQNLESASALAAAQAAAAAEQAGQPLEKEPDATVPITSEPAGGAIQ